MATGTQYIPSAYALAAPVEIGVFASLTEQQINEQQIRRLAQEEQAAAVTSTATNEYNAIQKQGQALMDQAGAQIAQGGMGLTMAAASTIYQGYRSKTEEYQKLQTQQSNIKGWQDALDGKNGSFGSAQAEQAQAAAIKDTELNDLRHGINGQDLKDSPPNQALAGIAAKLRNAKLSEQQGDADPIEVGKLYDDISKKLRDEQKEVKQSMETYQTATNSFATKLDNIGQGAGAFTSGIVTTFAAKETKDQAGYQASKEYAQFVQQTLSGSVNTADKTFDTINGVEQDAIRTLIQGLSQANARV